MRPHHGAIMATHAWRPSLLVLPIRTFPPWTSPTSPPELPEGEGYGDPPPTHPRSPRAYGRTSLSPTSPAHLLHNPLVSLGSLKSGQWRALGHPAIPPTRPGRGLAGPCWSGLEGRGLVVVGVGFLINQAAAVAAAVAAYTYSCPADQSSERDRNWTPRKKKYL